MSEREALCELLDPSVRFYEPPPPLPPELRSRRGGVTPLAEHLIALSNEELLALRAEIVERIETRGLELQLVEAALKAKAKDE